MPGFFWKIARHTFWEYAWNKGAAIRGILNGSYTVPYYSVFQVNKACSSILVISSVVDPAPYRSALILVGWIRIRFLLVKNNPEKRKKCINLLDVLFWGREGFSCSFDVLLGGLGIAILIKKKFFSVVKFHNVWSSYSWVHPHWPNNGSGPALNPSQNHNTVFFSFKRVQILPA
jgi:hypothetical protein